MIHGLYLEAVTIGEDVCSITLLWVTLSMLRLIIIYLFQNYDVCFKSPVFSTATFVELGCINGIGFQYFFTWSMKMLSVEMVLKKFAHVLVCVKPTKHLCIVYVFLTLYCFITSLHASIESICHE